MELTGKILELLPEEKGTSGRGAWRKQSYILETEGQYPKKVCFMAWGDKIDEFNFQVGEQVVVSINLESREYNGRWYTDVKAWKVERGSTTESSATPAPQPDAAPPVPPPYDDDIPF